MLSWWERQQILWSLAPEERIKAILMQARLREEARQEQLRLKRVQREQSFEAFVALCTVGMVGLFVVSLVAVMPLPARLPAVIGLGVLAPRIERRMFLQRPELAKLRSFLFFFASLMIMGLGGIAVMSLDGFLLIMKPTAILVSPLVLVLLWRLWRRRRPAIIPPSAARAGSSTRKELRLPRIS